VGDEARLDRVRLEYAQALDSALARVRGEEARDVFTPYLRPVVFSLHDLEILAAGSSEPATLDRTR
jgi:hypothetical protein